MALQPARHPLVSQWLNGSMVIDNMGLSTGKRFYVHSGTGTDAAGYGYSPDLPCATVDYAIANLCTASQGDIIYAMPGHAESLAADSAVDMDKAGITIWGLGYGASRPTFTCTAAAGDFKLATASSVIRNLLFLNDVDNSTGLLEVSAADCGIFDVEIREADGAKFADSLLITTASADRLTLKNIRIRGNAADGAVDGILLIGADDVVMENITIWGDFSKACIHLLTTPSLRGEYRDLYLYNEDATAGGDAIKAFWDEVTASTGTLRGDIHCQLGLDAANTTGAVTAATFVYFGNTGPDTGPSVVNAVGECPQMNIDTFTASTDA